MCTDVDNSTCTFLITITKYLARSNLRRGRFILAYSFRGHVPSPKGKVWQQEESRERESAHTVSTVRKERENHEVRLGYGNRRARPL